MVVIGLTFFTEDKSLYSNPGIEVMGSPTLVPTKVQGTSPGLAWTLCPAQNQPNSGLGPACLD